MASALPTHFVKSLLLRTLLSALAVCGATAHVFHKRGSVTPLVTVNVPLTVNSDQRYVVDVNMSSSPNTQRFKFALAANTGYSAVAGTACNGCDGVPTYNASASSSEQAWPGSKNITVGTTSLVGPLIKENCGLHEVNGSAWQYPNQTIIVANTSSSLFSNVTSGLVGLGTNANGATGDFLDTIFGQWLTNNPSHDNFTFGMALQPPVFTTDDDAGNGGILHWVVPKSSAYVGNITWNTANVTSAIVDAPTSGNGVSETVSNSSPELPESDWVIEMDGWAATISGTTVSNSSKAQAVVEPFFPDIFFPQGQANLFYTAIPSATKLNSFIDGAQAWSIPCDTKLSVGFTFSGEAFPLDEAQLITMQSDGTCTGTIKAWPDPTVSDFLLGSNFISAFYLIFVIGRSGSGIPNSIGLASRASASSKTHIGTIVGGSVGGVVFVVIIVAAAYALGRRSQMNRSKASPELPHPTDGEKGKLCADREIETDDEGAQYVAMPIIHLAPNDSRTQIPSPLSSARSTSSTYPLLPEAQYLRSPALNISSAPNTPMDFLSMSSSPLGRHDESGSSAMNHISYNSSALSANIMTSRAAISNTDNQNFIVEPFVLPATFGVHGQPSTSFKFPSSQSGWPLGTSDLQHSNVSVPSTIATGATPEPFVLPPPLSRSARTRDDKPHLTPLQALRDGTDTPLPPYIRWEAGQKLLNPVSPTLVEYSPSTIPPRQANRG